MVKQQFSPEALKEASEAAIQEARREVAKVQQKGVNVHPHVLAFGENFLRNTFERSVPRIGVRSLGQYLTALNAHDDDPIKRAVSYGLHAGFGTLGIQLSECQPSDSSKRLR